MAGTRNFWQLCLTIALSTMVAAVWAGEADVVGVEIRPGAVGSYSFDVSVSHADEGWEHYADAFEILTLDGEVLGTRILLHPHVGERPFTRSISGVQVPDGTDQVRVRARDLVHGYGGAQMIVELDQTSAAQ